MIGVPAEPPPRPSTARLSMPPMATLEQVSRPRALAVAFWCWLTGSVLVLAIVAVAATKIEPMRAEFAALARDRDPAAARATIDQVASTSVLVIIGVGALLAVLGSALGYALRAGRGWARVVLIVVALVAVGYTALVSSALSDPMLGTLRAPVNAALLAYTALVVVATAGMVLPGTSVWFRRPKER